MKKNSAPLRNLLESVRKLLSLQVCYHDYLMESGLSETERIHSGKFCISCKGATDTKCIVYCGSGGVINQKLIASGDSLYEQCPYGIWQFSVPIFIHSHLSGVLFASRTYDRKQTSILEKELYLPLLESVSLKIGELLSEKNSGEGSGIKASILKFMERAIEQKTNLNDLSEHLELSISRTSHLVKEIFGESFSQLIIERRLSRGAFYLAMDEMAVAEIAQRLCFYDQSHFVHAFQKGYGMSPTEYRKKSRKSY